MTYLLLKLTPSVALETITPETEMRPMVIVDETASNTMDSSVVSCGA